MRLSRRTFSTATKLSSVLAFAFAIGAGDGSPADAAVTSLSAEETIAYGWDGLGDNFDLRWRIDRKRINWRRTTSSTTDSNVSGVVISTGGGGFGPLIITPLDFMPPRPMELDRAFRSYSSNAMANIRAGGEEQLAQKKVGLSFSGHGKWTSWRGHRAEVIDLDDIVVGEGWSFASTETEVVDQAFSLTNQLLVGSRVDPTVDNNSQAWGRSTTAFLTTYKVNEPMDFNLVGHFRAAAGIDATLTLRDQASGELAHEQKIEGFDPAGEKRTLALSGQFSPGTYVLRLDLSSSHIVRPTGVVDRGGLGEFKLDFNATALDAGDFDDDGRIDRQDLEVWAGNFGDRRVTRYARDGDLDRDDYEAWLRTNAATLFAAEGLATPEDFQTWIDDNIVGDADGDLGATGRDFLIWQRQADATQATTQTVPEPASAWLMASAVLLLRRRR